jgi:hypothetical protein|tara:strand:+ start:57 stop:458 length:402 start_codon:yes stop_codon:yes gene_type:complete
MTTKTNNTTTATIDFAPLSQAMADAHNSKYDLADALREIYDASGEHQTVADFRKQFINWAMSPAGGHAYSKDWAKACLVDANIRLRAPRKDSGKARSGSKAAKTKVEKAIRHIKGLDLNKTEVRKLIAALAEL